MRRASWKTPTRRNLACGGDEDGIVRGFRRCVRSRPAFSSVDVQTARASERPLSSPSVLSASEREWAAFEGDARE